MFRRLIASFLCITFGFTNIPYSQAQEFSINQLPVPGTMVSVSPSFDPALIKGLTVHKDNPFLFDFIVDPGQSKLSQEELKEESDRMIKYFFAALTIPDRDIWVNLSPYEKDRMIPESLGVTAMGRDLLAQDYMLKQLTASLIYPQQALGKEFWAKVYAQAEAKYGTTQIPVNTFNKVWIVPQSVGIYEHGQTAYIVDGHLKVMLEEDYLSLTKHNAISNSPGVIARSPQGDEAIFNRTTNGTHAIGSQIIRQIVLPEIEKEINEDKNFSTLRQIFYAQALAVWFKNNLKQALLNRVYANKAEVKGIDQNNSATNEAIYQQYLRAYKKGVFNYIKEDVDPVTQETLPRKYFSGGWNSAMMAKVEQRVELSPNAAGAVAVKAADDVDETVVVDTNGADARALAKNVDTEFRVGGLDLRNIEITSGPEVAAFLEKFGLPVSASGDLHVIVIASQSIDLTQPQTFTQAFDREIGAIGALDPKDMTPEDKAMLGDLSTWFNVVLGVHFAGIATLSAAIVKSTHEFYKGKNATTMEVKREYFKRFRKDWMHIAGAATIVVTGVILGAMHGMNIDSIKMDLLATLTGSKIGGGIFGFEKMADELVAASNATDDVNDPNLKAVENFKGNLPRAFFFKYTDWPMMAALFTIAYTKFPASWNPVILQHVINYVNHVPHLAWLLPVIPVLMGVGIGATLATQVDKNRPSNDAAMTVADVLNAKQELMKISEDKLSKETPAIQVLRRALDDINGAVQFEAARFLLRTSDAVRVLAVDRDDSNGYDEDHTWKLERLFVGLMQSNDLQIRLKASMYVNSHGDSFGEGPQINADKVLGDRISFKLLTSYKQSRRVALITFEDKNEEVYQITGKISDFSWNEDKRIAGITINGETISLTPVVWELDGVQGNNATIKDAAMTSKKIRQVRIGTTYTGTKAGFLKLYKDIQSGRLKRRGLKFRDTLPGENESRWISLWNLSSKTEGDLKKIVAEHSSLGPSYVIDENSLYSSFTVTDAAMSTKRILAISGLWLVAMVSIPTGGYLEKTHFLDQDSVSFFQVVGVLGPSAISYLIYKAGKSDKAALAINPAENGGIDLSEQGSALHITKDANGGVEVNVDPALIARIEREGMSEIDPVIIGMRPADIQSLFGVKVLTSTP